MTRFVVVTGFLIAFVAGFAAGVVFGGRPAHGNGPGEGGRGGFLANHLRLSADQQQRMKAIWQDVGKRGGPDQRGRRGEIRREQEDAVAKLIRDEDKAAYDRIVGDARQKIERMDEDNRRAFAGAVDKTKAILTPEQLTKYEAFLSRSPGDRDKPATRPVP